jgi:hypothetical protein
MQSRGLTARVGGLLVHLEKPVLYKRLADISLCLWMDIYIPAPFVTRKSSKNAVAPLFPKVAGSVEDKGQTTLATGTDEVPMTETPCRSFKVTVGVTSGGVGIPLARRVL